MKRQEGRNPGAGAIEFIKQFTEEGMNRDEVAEIIGEVMRGELHDSEDKRVKLCDYCGYYWRDPSLRNTRKTCSDECKRGIKTLQRREQRRKQELANPKPKKKTLKDDYYDHHEYPFWVDEYSMSKISWKYERSEDVEFMDAIQYNIDHYGDGNRKVSNKYVEYDGDDRDNPSLYF